MKKIWVNVAHSFKEAEEFDREYYFQMSPQERLDIMQQLRTMQDQFFVKGIKKRHGYRKRLQRVVKITQQT